MAGTTSDKLDPVHPGDILLHDFLEPLDMTPTALARHIKVSVPTVNEIVRGKKSLTANIAKRLEAAFGSSAEFWMGIQAQYDLEIADARLAGALKGIARVVKRKYRAGDAVEVFNLPPHVLRAGQSASPVMYKAKRKARAC